MKASTPAAGRTPHGSAPDPERIVDAFGRPFTYLRVAVTDLCNLRCVYCMPEEGIAWLPRDQVLSFEEILTVVQAAADCGVRKVRITGGEPLARKGIAELTGMIAAVPGIADLAMTSNGVLLGKYAPALAKAGLMRLNISLDTLDPEKFAAIARRGRLRDVRAGLEAARRAGFAPLKINMVVLGGLNDEETPAFAALSVEHPWEVRFIEYMPLQEAKGCARGSGHFDFVSNALTKERIEARFGALLPLEVGDHMRGAAEVWRIRGAAGRLGFISAMSSPFCARCDRLRLTATGELRSCLLDGGGVNLKAILRGGGGRREIIEAFRQAAHLKPEVHRAREAIPNDRMSRIGG